MKRYTRTYARRSLLHTVVFRTLSQAATFASYVVLVRGMSEQSFGVLSLLYAMIPMLSTAFSLGIEQTLRRYQPEYLRSGQLQTAAWLMRVGSSARLFSNLLVLSALLLAWNWVAPLFQLGPYRVEFALFCLLILLHFQSSLLQLSLSSHMLQAHSVGMTLLLPLVKLAGYSVLYHFHSLTLINAIGVDLLGYCAMCLGLRIAHARHCAAPAVPGEPVGVAAVSREERKRLWRYSLYNNFNDAGTMLLTSRSDNFFIAALINPVATGAYSFYNRLSEMASQILPVRQFGNVIQPLFFAVPKEQAAMRIPRYFTLLMNSALALQLPITAYAVAYHREVVDLLFDGKFFETSWMMAVVMGFATVNRIAEPVGLVAQYEEQAAVILKSKILVVYNVLTMLAFVPLWGIYGAAVSTGSSQIFKNLYIWWHVRRTARWTNFGAVLSMTALIWGGAIGACIALKALIGAHHLLNLGSGGLICGLAALLYLRSPAISDSDRELIGSILHGKERRALLWLGLSRP